MPLVVVCASGEFDYPCRTKKKKRKKKEDKIIRKGRRADFASIYIYIYRNIEQGRVNSFQRRKFL